LQVIHEMSTHTLETICNNPELGLQLLCRGTQENVPNGNNLRNGGASSSSGTGPSYENPIDVEVEEANADSTFCFDETAFQRILEITRVDEGIARDVYNNCGWNETETINKLLELQFS